MNNSIIRLNKFTNHLVDFEYLDGAISLKGEELTILKKMVYYFLIGLLSKNKKIIVKKIKEDTRFYITVIMKSGKGKGNIKTAVLNIGKKIVKKYGEVYSLQSEQLVGKTTNKRVEKINDEGKKIKVFEKVQVLGYFSYDLLVFEEASDLFESPKGKGIKDSNEIRQAMCIAYDSPDKNRISKKLVDDEYGEKLDYLAECSAIHLTQPINFDPNVLKKGFARRNLFFQPENDLPIDEIIDYQLEGDDNYSEMMANNFTELLKGIKEEVTSKFNDWKFSDEVIKEMSFFSKTIANYFKLEFKECVEKNGIEATIVPTFIKFISVASIFTKNAPNVSILDVKIAFMDVFEFYTESLTAQQSNTAPDEDCSYLFVLDWLKESDYTPSIKEVKQRIVDEMDVSVRTAQRYLSDLKAKNLVYVKKGQHNSYVKLVESGQSGQSGQQKESNDNDTIHSIFHIYNKISNEVKDFFEKKKNNLDVSNHSVYSVYSEDGDSKI
ncbi:MAG: hypothetical protein KKH52_04555 [Nanoarchaeota archaeon]|nr:hypothetical protein [Nanoarchaeota archaeon]MBU1974637.1 hypothetical protein [Nanoarchaeota archaeon]